MKIRVCIYLFFLHKQTIKAAIQAVSGVVVLKAIPRIQKISHRKLYKKLKLALRLEFDPLEGTSQQQTDDVSEILSALEDDVSESEKGSLKDCATCTVMANKIRQLRNRLKYPPEQADCCKEGAILFTKDR